jgi:hypothetical protein
LHHSHRERKNWMKEMSKHNAIACFFVLSFAITF